MRRFPVSFSGKAIVAGHSSDGDSEFDEAVEKIHERGARQLRAGRLTRLSDRIAGGPRRPGEQKVTRSPVLLTMLLVSTGLAIVAAVFWILVLRETEKTRFENALRALDEAKYNEAVTQFEEFLLVHPSGEYSNRARILLHTAKIRRYTDASTFSVESVVAAERSLEEFFRHCQDLPEFADERERLIRWAEKIARAAAEVAVKTASQEALNASQSAYARLDSLTGSGGLSAEARDRILKLHSRASAEILKKDLLKSSLGDIQRLLDDSRPLDALRIYQGLLDRYEVLREDRGYADVMERILETEQSLVHVDETPRDAVTSEADEHPRPALSLNLRTAASSGLVSQDTLVFGSGGDAVFALDAETGMPVWKRPLGVSVDTAPILVEGRVPAVLLVHGGRHELMLVSQADQTLLWRQSVESAVTGPPIVIDQDIYVTTAAGQLWQIAAGSGRSVARVQFSQPVTGPPALSRDGESLVIPGQQAFVYTLERRSLKCRAVSWSQHRDGSVVSPMLAMGHLFLLCENRSEDCLLRALEMDEHGRLSERERQTVLGRVMDPCLLRGEQLFVPSTPQRIAAFRISDRADNDVFSLIDTNQVENAELSKMFLVSGASGHLWMASTALRRFEVTEQTVVLDKAVVAEGQHLYPIQADDDDLLVTTRQPWSSSVFFTRVNRETMTGQWRTALRTNLVAAAPSASGNSLVAVSDFGEVFRVPLSDIAEGGFHTRSLSRFRLPDDLNDPVEGTVLSDGRLAAWCYGDDARIWTTRPTGQFEQLWRLPAEPQARPAPFAGGLAVPLPGRIRLTAVRNRVEDYQVEEPGEADVHWRFVVPVGQEQLLAVRSDGQVIRLEYRTSPTRHLAEIGIARLPGDIELIPAATQELICVATSDGRLVLLGADGLERIQERSVDGGIVGGPFVSGNRVFVIAADDRVCVYSLDERLEETGVFASPGGRLTDAPLPLPDGGFLAVFQGGSVVHLDEQGQPTGRTDHLGQPLQSGPIRTGDAAVVVAEDGSLFLWNDLAEGQDE